MLRFLADENFNNHIVRGLLWRQPDLDLVRAQDVGLAGVSDADLLGWAAQQDRITLTHDRATLAPLAARRVAAGGQLPGVFLVSPRMFVGQAIDELLLLATCSEPGEWTGLIVALPL